MSRTLTIVASLPHGPDPLPREQVSFVERRVGSARRAIGAAAAARHITTLAFVSLVLATLGLLAVRLGADRTWTWGVAATLAAAAIVRAILTCVRDWPTRAEAAAAIDREFGLRDTFGTAVYLRDGGTHAERDNDPRGKDVYAVAILRQAERTAEGVDVRRRFRPALPPLVYGVAAVASTFVLLWLFMPASAVLANLLGGSDNLQGVATTPEGGPKTDAETKGTLEDTLDKIDAAPTPTQQAPEVAEAREQLRRALAEPRTDAQTARGLADEAERRLREATERQQNARASSMLSREMQRLTRGMDSPQTPADPLAAAFQEAMQRGDFEAARDAFEQMRQKVEGAKADEGEAGASPEQVDQQMRDLFAQMSESAAQLSEQTRNSAEEIEGQFGPASPLEELGLTSSEMDTLMRAYEKLADGDTSAADEIAQVLNDAAERLNEGRGPTPQQQQGIDDMVERLRSQAEAQQMAKQLADALDRLAQGDLSAMDEIDRLLNGMCQGQGPGLGVGEGRERLGHNPVETATEGEYGTSPVRSSSQDRGRGEIVAEQFVRGTGIAGESQAQLRGVVRAEAQRASEEVDTTRVSPAARKVTREYFRDLIGE